MKRKVLQILTFCLLLMALTACSAQSGSKAGKPVTLTIWHVYGGQTVSPLNEMIDTFNATVGKEENMQVEVTLVSNTNTIHEDVLAAANHDPGAAELPDLFMSYPKTVLAMPDDEILVDFRDYFTEEELAQFLPPFLEEGVIGGRQVILPVAKSTEVLFVNKTIFDRFAADTGAKLSDLATWEGLYQMASDYTAWSDAQTPEIPNDGKAFFAHDYHFNYFQVGVESLGEAFFDGDTLAFGPKFAQVWEPYAKAALEGGLWLQGGYSTAPLRTGDCVASVASSASVLYFSDVVTYMDNTSEKAEIISLPCPVFADGQKLVTQRGSGLCLVHSTPEREQAAVTFLKWLTEPRCNTRLVTSLGYMPVTEEAFTTWLPQEIETLTDPKYQSLYEAYRQTGEKYTFYVTPQLPTYLELETAFEQNIRLNLLQGREDYLQQPPSDEALAAEAARTLEKFQKSFSK